MSKFLSIIYRSLDIFLCLATCYILTSLPQEQAAKTDMLSMVSIQVLCTVDGVANACI